MLIGIEVKLNLLFNCHTERSRSTGSSVHLDHNTASVRLQI